MIHTSWLFQEDGVLVFMNPRGDDDAVAVNEIAVDVDATLLLPLLCGLTLYDAISCALVTSSSACETTFNLITCSSHSRSDREVPTGASFSDRDEPVGASCSLRVTVLLRWAGDAVLVDKSLSSSSSNLLSSYLPATSEFYGKKKKQRLDTLGVEQEEFLSFLKIFMWNLHHTNAQQKKKKHPENYTGKEKNHVVHHTNARLKKKHPENYMGKEKNHVLTYGSASWLTSRPGTFTSPGCGRSFFYASDNLIAKNV